MRERVSRYKVKNKAAVSAVVHEIRGENNEVYP